ncbi:amidase [Nocardioides daeguensis]|uniref:Amidase n=1 Tax=Nocardioides daeguensis TaxID=908359 RepID=A0ABP6UYY6_9ACTN|nr:amidase [Nocardioides daeguensis]MBV6727063.1 amidase [Nocardioides daeguensis]MCR1771534.1 amidase [Nocardioides daeguensis]
MRVHAFTDDALDDLDAVGLAEHLGAGKLSAAEAAEAAIARIEAVDGELNAMAYVAYDRARSDARNLRPGYLAGVPTLVKDNVDVAGMPTRSGTDAWEPRPAKRNGDFADMYLATGLVPLGKSQLSEYGFSASAEHPRLGAVRTPWDTERTAGASSSGSAALVAAGAVPLAHANDGGGSIRIPAAVNGLVGLKPTRGRLAQDKLFRDMPIRIISDGVVTRSVRDTAAFYREAERHYRNLDLPPIGDLTRPIKRRLRIALTTSGVGRSADAETRALTEQTASLLEDLGHTVTETEVPVAPSFVDDFLLYWALLAQAMLTTGRPFHGRSWDASKHDNLTLGLARHARRNLHKVPGAIARLKRAGAQAELYHQKYDVALTPTLATGTPKVGHLDPTQDYATIIDRLLDWVAFTPWQNITGAPAISLPLATTAGGLPQGMMLGAGRGQEAVLIELAYELEQARPFARIQG